MQVAVIPARAGSKRIPRKNIRSFAGKPMLAYAIEVARTAGVFDHIIVSTDDDEIAATAERLGAAVPFRRPAALADDSAPTVPVIAHAVRWCLDQGIRPDAACCVYPGVPLLRASRIVEGLNLLLSGDAAYVLAVMAYPAPIQRALRVGDNNLISMVDQSAMMARTQDLEPAFHDAGQFYWARSHTWASETPVFASAAAVVLGRDEAIDIDTPEDWALAERLFLATRTEAV